MGKAVNPQRKTSTVKEKLPKAVWKKAVMRSKITKPQKSRKHKKIKAVDPFYKGPRVVDRKAAHANLAPKKKDKDDSALPRSVQEMLTQRQEAEKRDKEGKKPKNKFKQEYSQDPMYLKSEKGMTCPLKKVPVFKQKGDESDEQYLARVNNETRTVIQMSQFENKYDVDVERGENGELQYFKRKRDGRVKKVKKSEKSKGRNLKKMEKVKDLKLEKLKDKVENFEEFEDKVEFGEVAMAPPMLTSKPRKVDNKTNRPGTKSLLLKTLVPEKSSAAARKPGEVRKRKHMSIAEQRVSDADRQRAIDMYRKMKKQKASSATA